MLKSILRSGLKTWLLLLVFVVPGMVQAATTSYFNTVFAFDRTSAIGGVVFGSDGALYGTSYSTSYGSGGLIYRVTVDGANPQTLYQLNGDQGNGYSPRATLLLGSDGYFYGTTHFGPRSGYNYSRGSGTIFKIKQDGTGFTTIHVFADATDTSNLINADGMYPDAALIEDADGFLYGVTTSGGTYGKGTVYRVAKDGASFQSLHSFAAVDSSGFNSGGTSPAGKLLLAADGRLYGVTSAGGSTAHGAVYSLGVDGSGFESIYEFSALDSDSKNEDGVTPRGALVQVNNLIYGVTTDGGTSSNGTIYSLATDGTAANTTLTTLHNFAGAAPNDAAVPGAGLILAGDGRLYGTTTSGAASSSDSSVTTAYGTVFAMSLDGTDFEILHAFTSGEGSSPQTELIQADNSETYFGTTASNGACGYGTVFRLSVGATATQQSNGHTSCEISSSGGGAMGSGLLLLLSALGFAPTVRRSWTENV